MNFNSNHNLFNSNLKVFEDVKKIYFSNNLESKKEAFKSFILKKSDLENKLTKLNFLYNDLFLKIPPYNNDLQLKIVKLKKIFYRKEEAKNLNYDKMDLNKQDIEDINELLCILKYVMFKINDLFKKGSQICVQLDELITKDLVYEFHFKNLFGESEEIIIEIERKLKELKGHIKALTSLANVANLFPEFEKPKQQFKPSFVEERLFNFLDLMQDIDLQKFKSKGSYKIWILLNFYNNIKELEFFVYKIKKAEF